ncbi:hypothetical protein KJ359_006380 [Pestalotiopsis sp. 9143b]|nr:hypothetical protein KJ359_006380 [Pestalotiopsis sp. 9143b]
MPDGSSSIPEIDPLTMSTMEVDSVVAAGAGGSGGRDNSQKRRYNCGQLYHISSNCPLPETEDTKARKNAAQRAQKAPTRGKPKPTGKPSDPYI